MTRLSSYSLTALVVLVIAAGFGLWSGWPFAAFYVVITAVAIGWRAWHHPTEVEA